MTNSTSSLLIARILKEGSAHVITRGCIQRDSPREVLDKDVHVGGRKRNEGVIGDTGIFEVATSK